MMHHYYAIYFFEGLAPRIQNKEKNSPTKNKKRTLVSHGELLSQNEPEWDFFRMWKESCLRTFLEFGG